MSELKIKSIEKKIYLFLFFLLITIVIIYLFEVVTPFCIAFIIVYLSNPIKIFLDKYINKKFSSFLSIICFILFFLSILILIFPIIVHQVQNLTLLLPGYLIEIENLL